MGKKLKRMQAQSIGIIVVSCALFTRHGRSERAVFFTKSRFRIFNDTPNGEILRQRLDPRTVGHWVIQKCSSPCQKAIFAPTGPLLMPKGVFGLPIMGTLKSPVTTRMAHWLIRSRCRKLYYMPRVWWNGWYHIIRNNRGTGLYARSDERRSNGGTDIRDGVGRQRTTGTSGNLIKDLDMKVLIIGGGGVIGQKLARKLADRGHLRG